MRVALVLPRRMSTNMKKSINRIGGAVITLLMVAGVFLATSVTAQAQYRQYPESRNRQERRDQIGRAHV